MTRKDRVMAFICQICPPCILARKYPNSLVGKIVAKEKQHCPFCRAYDSVQGSVKREG